MKIEIKISAPELKRIKKKISGFKSRFKELRSQFWFFFTPFIIFIVLDLITTYYGVCVLEGFEINLQAIKIASQHGYLSLFPYQIGRYGMLIFLLTVLYLKAPRFEWKILFLVIWGILIFSYLRTTALNLNNLIFLATGKTMIPPQEIAYYPPEQLKRAKVEFEKAKANFCRLI